MSESESVESERTRLLDVEKGGVVSERTRLLDVENGGVVSDYSQIRRNKSASSHETMETLSQSSDKSDMRDIFELSGDYDKCSALTSATLAWRDVHASVETYTRAPWFTKKLGKYSCKDILKRVTGLVGPGQFVSILGPSGAGKTTMLKTLAMRKMENVKVTGSIQVNGWPIESSQMSLISSYVDKEDHLVGELTVRETFIFHANLRMDKRRRVEKRLAKVDHLINKLKLNTCENRRVSGTDNASISGAEKKLLSIGLELLTDPLILFIDEPTSNLEYFEAESIVKEIAGLASSTRTVLMTMSHPKSADYEQFDRVCLMTEGHVIYLGESGAAVKHFQTLDRPCPNLHNPAEHFLRELAVKSGTQGDDVGRIESFVNYYKDSENYRKMDEGISFTSKISSLKPNIISRKVLPITLAGQYRENARRGYLLVKRSLPFLTRQVLRTVVVGLTIALCFYRVRNNQDVTQNKAGLLFFYLTYLSFTWSSAATALIPSHFPVIRRDYSKGMYGVCPCLLTALLICFPIQTLLLELELVLFYFFTGLHWSALAFYNCYFACYSVVWVASSVGFFCGSVTRTARAARRLMLAFILPSTLFGGLYINSRTVPYLLRPLKHLSWIKYGWSAAMANEFQNVDYIECSAEREIEYNFTCRFQNGAEILSLYQVENTVWWPNLVMNILLGLGMFFLSFLCLWWRVRR